VLLGASARCPWTAAIAWEPREDDASLTGDEGEEPSPCSH
jgi:hypothetical protein